LLSFSRILKWMFEKYEELTLALLTGFLIGSLNKVWPWKQTVSVWYKHTGTAKDQAFPLVQKNVMPGDYSLVTIADEQLGLITKNPELISAIALAFIGFMVIFILDRASGNLQK